MQIGVKKAVTEHLRENDVRRLGENPVGIVMGLDKCRAVIDSDAGHARQRQHAFCRARPIHGGYQQAGIAGEILGEFGSGRRLEPQIHFRLHGIGECFDHVARP